jgi:hypothetical protein
LRQRHFFQKNNWYARVRARPLQTNLAFELLVLGLQVVLMAPLLARDEGEILEGGGIQVRFGVEQNCWPLSVHAPAGSSQASAQHGH